jgi:hypothetical protein
VSAAEGACDRLHGRKHRIVALGIGLELLKGALNIRERVPRVRHEDGASGSLDLVQSSHRACDRCREL